MKIRARMFVVAVAVALPQLVGLVWWDGVSRHAAAQAGLGGMLDRTLSEPGAGEACLAGPRAWSDRTVPPPHRGPPRGGPPDGSPPRGPRPGGRGKPRLDPPTLHAYSLDDLPADVASAVTDDGISALKTSVFSSRVGVVARSGWGGGCEVIVVRGATVRGFMGSVLPASPLWVAPMLLVATIMWLAVWPTVRRLQNLNRAVREGEYPVGMGGSDEIASLSRAFDEAVGALEREAQTRRDREEALREFVAHTTHDVRIPLTVLRGHLAALESGVRPEALQGAVREAHYLGTLLDDLAAHARMEAPQPLAPVELGPLIQRVVARHAPIARRSRVGLEHAIPEEPVVVHADLTLAEQAVSNLVYNAIRHNHAGGHVAVILDTDDDGVSIEVIDDGPGLDPEALAAGNVAPSPSRSRDSAGEGLGLLIVRRVAERHGWSFTLENGDDGGLRACLRALRPAFRKL